MITVYLQAYYGLLEEFTLILLIKRHDWKVE